MSSGHQYVYISAALNIFFRYTRILSHNYEFQDPAVALYLLLLRTRNQLVQNTVVGSFEENVSVTVHACFFVPTG